MSQTILKNEKVIAVGNFDGVHLGHVKVLKAAVALAKELNCIAAAMTFNPHPRDFFAGKGSVEKITDEITKTELILQCGIRDHIIEAFNWEFAEMDAEKFADYLKNKFNCCAIVCGANFRFGKKAAYGTEELKKACEKFQMKALICNYEEGFSSTRIRNLLTEGDVTGAEKLLGRPFHFTERFSTEDISAQE